MRKKLLIFTSLTLGLALAAPLFAATMKVPSGKEGVVAVNELEPGDLYVAGGAVTVKSPVEGDAFVAGGALNITGGVSQDLIAAGGNVNILSDVGGDLRTAGGNLTIDANIGEDALAAGGTVLFLEGTRIGGDLWAAGGSISVNAEVAGGVKIAGEDVTINSKVGGDIFVQATRLTFGPGADVAGKVTYKGVNEAVVRDGAVVGDIKFTKTERRSGGVSGAVTAAGFIFGLIMMLVASLLLFVFFGNTAKTVSVAVVARPWTSIGLGFSALVVIPVATLVFFISGIGLYAGVIVLVWFVLALLVTAALTGIFVGSAVVRWWRKTEDLPMSWKTVAAGVIIVSLLKLLPVVGWVLCALIYLAVFGGALRTMKAQIVAFHMHRE